VCGFSPDGRTVASASDDHTVIIWDSTSGKPLQTLRGHTSGVSSLCFLPDGRLVSGGRDGTVRYWNPDSGRLLATCYNLDAGADYLMTTPEGYYGGSLGGANWSAGSSATNCAPRTNTRVSSASRPWRQRLERLGGALRQAKAVVA